MSKKDWGQKMKALGEIELELSRLGVHNRFWGKPEINELENILNHEEKIAKAVNGRYNGGFCLVVATDRRLLLIDKKMWFLSIEDVRFDMISELDYCARLLDSTLSVRTINKIMRVTSIRQKMLRQLTGYLQDRVMELRQMSIQTDGGQHLPQVVTQSLPYIPVLSSQAPLVTEAQPLAQQQQQPFHIEQPAAPAALPSNQQFYTTTPISLPRTRSLRRIGSYPTSSLTMQHMQRRIAP